MRLRTIVVIALAAFVLAGCSTSALPNLSPSTAPATGTPVVYSTPSFAGRLVSHCDGHGFRVDVEVDPYGAAMSQSMAADKACTAAASRSPR